MNADYKGKTDHQRSGKSWVEESELKDSESQDLCDKLEKYYKENLPGYASKSLMTTPFREILEMM